MITIYVIDLEGNEYAIQSTSTNEGEVNGNQSLSAIILPSKVNKAFINDISEMWNVVDHDDVEHKIIYARRRGEGTSLSVEIKAIPLFFDVLDNDRIYKRYDEHMTAKKAFDRIFKDTGFTYVLVDSFSAVEWEGFGEGETKLETFKRALERYKCEFRIRGNTVYLESQIGRDTQFQYRHRLNASNIVQEIDANEMWTYAKGYGDYGDGEGGEDWQEANLEREYTSKLANVIGIRHAPPIKNGNITTKKKMDEELKKLVDESLKISVSADVVDLQKQGYPIAQTEIGDRVFLIDERIGLDEEVRVVEQSITRNWKGEVTDVSLTFGSEGLTKRHQGKIDTAVKDITDILDGNKQIPFSALDNAVQQATKDLKSAQTELIFDNGIIAQEKDDPNKLVLFNSAGIGISDDGGGTFTTAMTGSGIVADVVTAGTFRGLVMEAMEMYGSTIEGTEIYGGYIEGAEFYSEHDSDDYMRIRGAELLSHGVHERTWFGDTSTDNVRIMIQNGQIRARNDNKEWSTYFNDYGMSTFADGDGNNYDNAASGAIEFHSTRYANFRGLTIMSHGRTAIESSNEDGARIYLNPNGANVHVADADDNYFGITASKFNQSSSISQKRGIKDFEGDGLAIANSLRIKEYLRKTRGEETTEDKWQVGVIVEDTASEILADSESVDLYSYVNILARAIQQLDDKIEGGA